MNLRRTAIADPISRTVSYDVVRFDCGPHALISTASDLGIRPSIDLYVMELVWRGATPTPEPKETS